MYLYSVEKWVQIRQRVRIMTEKILYLNGTVEGDPPKKDIVNTKSES